MRGASINLSSMVVKKTFRYINLFREGDSVYSRKSVA